MTSEKIAVNNSTDSADDSINDSFSLSSEPQEKPYVPHGITTWKGRIWDSYDKPKEERWLLFKLDIVLLFISSTGVFLRYLDQANINNAFVSGMKEELHLNGNELNYANACFSVGYAISQIPSNLFLSKLKSPHYYIAFLEITWSVLTFCSSSFSGPKSMYVIRFFIGVFEAGHFPAVMYIASSWYRKEELSKRISIIQFNTSTGPLISSFLQSAAYSGLNHVHGRSGWRWLFIIDGIISLPLAFFVFFLLPDIPRTQKPNWIFKEEELALARARVPEEAKIYATFKWVDIKSWIGTWHVYFFSFLFVLDGLAGLPSSSMPYWFKSYPKIYTVQQINNYSATLYAVRIFVTVIMGFISDDYLKGRRYIVLAFNGLWMFGICVALAILPVHPADGDRSKRFAAYMLIGVYANGAQIWTWVNEATLGEPAKRAFAGATMNAFVYAFSAFVPILLFPTQDQPFVKKGNIACAVFSIASTIVALLGGYVEYLKKDHGFLKSVIWTDEAEEDASEEELVQIESDEKIIEKVDVESK